MNEGETITTIRWTAPLIAVLTVAAGCLGGTPSSDGTGSDRDIAIPSGEKPWVDYPRRLHELDKMVAFETRTEDGVALRGHVYLPKGEGPFATVLHLSPYWNTHNLFGHSESQEVEIDGRRTVGRWLTPFMDAGFALALINMRGYGESDGCFQWNSPTDWSDAATIVEALAAEPWSNGNVGMFGLSYDGWSQYMALAGKAPHLKAIIPVSGVIDPWNLWMRHGAPLQSAGTYWPIFFGLIATGALGLTAPEPFLGDTGPTHFACPNYPQDLVWNEEYAVGGDRDAYWQAQDLRPAIAASDVPIFFTNGMTNGEGHILQFDGLWDLISTPNKRMLVGQWGHGYPTSQRPDFPAMAVAWFDHYLRGGPQLVAPGVVEYQDAQENWHTVDHWPPESTPTPVYLSGDSMVLDETDVETASQMFQTTYETPGPQECSLHQALYVSPPLAQDLYLSGYFEVEFTLTSTLPDSNLAAFLFYTDGPGRCPDPSVTEIRRALYSLRHVSEERGEDFPVNEPTAVNVQSYPFATTVPAGSRLVLAIGGDSQSLFPEIRKPVWTISTGRGLDGQITLPVVEGEVAFAA